MPLDVATTIFLLESIAEGRPEIALPSEAATLAPGSIEAVALAAAFDPVILERLIAMVERGAADSIRSVLLTIFHTRAAGAYSRGDAAEGEAAFAAVLRLNPFDQNVRSVLAVSGQRSPGELVDLMEPVLDRLDPAVPQHRDALARAAAAAFELDRIDWLANIPDVGDEALSPRVRAFQRRAAWLAHAQASLTSPVAPSGPGDEFAQHAAAARRALNPHDFEQALEALATVAGGVNGPDLQAAVTEAVLLCAIARGERWGTAYRKAHALLAALLRDQATIDQGRAFWKALDLPDGGFTGVLLRARIGQPDEGRKILSRTPELLRLEDEVSSRGTGLEDFAVQWRSQLLAGSLETAATFAPSDFGAIGDGRDTDVARDSLEIPTCNADRAPIWYFLTWHEHPEKLLRTIPVLRGRDHTIIVSIGGAGEPSSIGLLSTLLLLDRIHLLFRPAVTWGGPKLLYQNAYEAFEAFDRRAGDNAWLQIICNRTYPLLSPNEIARLVAQPSFLARHPNIPPPPAWRGEWPDALVENLPDAFERAFRHPYATNTFGPLSEFAFDDTRLNAICFNFASTAEVLEKSFKDGSHQYSISPYSADMRWMSLGRMAEFIDTSTENGYTFVRRFPPQVLKWIHAVMLRHVTRTGDPFVLISAKFIRTILHDPGAIELFSAMNLGFGPEMNFFDTVAFSTQYGVRQDLGHQYYRTARYEAVTEDIGPASDASAIDRRFFMRKTSPGISSDFIRHFGDRIADEWSYDDLSFVLDDGRLDEAGAARPPSLERLLGADIWGARATLRNLTESWTAPIEFRPDGAMILGGVDHVGQCRFDDQGRLVVEYLVNGWGTKLYERPTSDDRRISLPPAEIVSQRNVWSVSIDVDLAGLQAAHATPDWIVPAVDAVDVKRRWTYSRSGTAALLEAFVEDKVPDYPVPAYEAAAGELEWREAGDTLLLATRIAGQATLLRYKETVVADGRRKLVFARTSLADVNKWAGGRSSTGPVGLRPQQLPGRYRLDLLEQVIDIALIASGEIVDLSGARIGWWFGDVGSMRLFGLDGLRAGVANQFQFRQDYVRLSGWGWRDMSAAVTFALTRIGDLA